VEDSGVMRRAVLGEAVDHVEDMGDTVGGTRDVGVNTAGADVVEVTDRDEPNDGGGRGPTGGGRAGSMIQK
jgi:hypothetical protein